jgi:hypothetical protein
MEKGKLLPLVVTAFFIVVISVFSFSLVNSNPSEPVTGKVSADGSENTESMESSKNGDSAVTNNVENNINGENAEVNNSIDNNIKNGENNDVDNNVSNNIDVKVDVKVTNDIGNNVEGNTSNSNTNAGDKEQQNSDKQEDNNKDNNQNGNKNNKEEAASNDDEVVWGVDSASLTTSEMLACVRENFGEPKVWGRYLGDKEGVSAGITPEEVELLHSNDIQILPIWNHFNDATGYENGKSEAEQAIKKAEELGIPEGVAIFADIEPSYPVDSEFIKGWHEVMSNSPYESGIYGIFDGEKKLTAAFNEAANNDSSILENTYIWTAAPNLGITSQSNAPAYKPDAPKNSFVGGWQYGIDAQSCNIDTNLFSGKVLEVLW